MDDVIVVGAGLSGLLATYLAHEKGAKVRLIAQGIGSLLVSPGWISVADGAPDDVLSGAQAIARESAEHPYALAGKEALHQGIEALRRMGDAVGLGFQGDLSRNLRLPSALGGLQTPALAPAGLARGDGLADGALYVGFVGWRDYYPALTGREFAFVQLPGMSSRWDASPVDLARRFDDPALRKAVAAGVRHSLTGMTAVGFPAVLGLADPHTAQRDLEDQLGVPVFELPTLPPSVPGTRLFNKVRRYLLDQGVRVQIGHPVVRGILDNKRVAGIEVGAAGKPQRFLAESVILATGGLYGGGLFSDDHGHIWEPLFDLPVQASCDRETWFRPTMLAPEGHPVHRVGIRVNEAMRPLDGQGDVIAENLYAAGHLLAQPGSTPTHQTHEGIALATAYKAVGACTWH